MERRSSPLTRLAAALAAVALAGGWAATARADIAYAFAEQTITNIAITPAQTALTGSIVNSVQDATTVNGAGPSNSGTTNIPQAYQGGAPASPENLYSRYAPGNPVPVSPTMPPSFTRSDAAITGSPPAAANQGQSVSESYLNSAGPANETGFSGWSSAFTFTPGSTGALTITYNFANDLYVWVGPGFSPGTTATGSYQFNVTIKDAAGNVVFSGPGTPNQTNLTLTAPPNGAEQMRTGMETVTTSSLTSGTTYTITFSGTTQTNVTTAVPEPGAVTLVAVSGVVALGVGAVRRRALRRAPK